MKNFLLTQLNTLVVLGSGSNPEGQRYPCKSTLGALFRDIGFLEGGSWRYSDTNPILVVVL